MTRFDLHPEELLERAERGVINAADRLRLEQHLAECAVCRVESTLSAQAARDAQPLRDEKLLLARLKRDVTRRLENEASAVPRARGKRAVVVVALLAASVASVATATTLVVMHRAAA